MCAAGGGSAGSGGVASTAGTGNAGSGGVSGAGAGNAPMTGGAGGEAPAPLEITIPPAPELCPGQAFALELKVSGGVAPYDWSLTDSGAATLSAAHGANTQLDGSADAAHPSVTVTVEDATSAKQTVVIALGVGAAGPGLCPVVARSAALPAACTNQPYNLVDAMSVTGGTAPFSWEALSIPAGLKFDSTTQTVSGTALPNPSNTPLTLRVTDTKGRQSQLSSTLEYRDKCWLAFTQSTNGDTQFRLYDPALKTHAAGVENSSNNTGVVDFKFSTDGELVTYRRATSDRNQELVLVNVPTSQEQVLAIPGTVLSYAWSPKAAILAVAYLDADGNTLIGGIDATNLTSSQSSVTLLNPTQVMDATYPRLDSDLLWLENGTLLAFHAALFSDIPGSDVPYVLGFDGTTFTFQGAIENLSPPPLDLEPAFGGLFVISENPQQPLLQFTSYTGDESDNFLRGEVVSAVADPAGLHVAAPFPFADPARDELEIFSTAASGGTGDPPMAWDLSRNGTLDLGCDSILAWNPAQEQVVCDVSAAAPSTTGEVRLYNLDASSKSATELTLLQLSGYHQGDAETHRRSFSPKGDRFAFTTRDHLFVANGVSAQVEFSLPLDPNVTPGQTGELAFAPDQSILLWQAGNELSALVLAKNGSQNWFGVGGDDLLPPPACSEEYPTGPRAWCGRSTPASSLAWDPSSHFAAAVGSARSVRVYDFSQFAAGGPASYADACSIGCNTDFVFQP